LAPTGSALRGADDTAVAPSSSARGYLVSATSSPDMALHSHPSSIAPGTVGATAELRGEWPGGPLELGRQCTCM
jgi:hypothetical protein